MFNGDKFLLLNKPFLTDVFFTRTPLIIIHCSAGERHCCDEAIRFISNYISCD